MQPSESLSFRTVASYRVVLFSTSNRQHLHIQSLKYSCDFGNTVAMSIYNYTTLPVASVHAVPFHHTGLPSAVSKKQHPIAG